MSEKKPKPRCVATWLADPKDCWLREGCRYWSRTETRCTYGEQHEQALEASRKELGK